MPGMPEPYPLSTLLEPGTREDLGKTERFCIFTRAASRAVTRAVAGQALSGDMGRNKTWKRGVRKNPNPKIQNPKNSPNGQIPNLKV